MAIRDEHRSNVSRDGPKKGHHEVTVTTVGCSIIQTRLKSETQNSDNGGHNPGFQHSKMADNRGFQHSKLLFHQGFISHHITTSLTPELENKKTIAFTKSPKNLDENLGLAASPGLAQHLALSGHARARGSRDQNPGRRQGLRIAGSDTNFLVCRSFSKVSF